MNGQETEVIPSTRENPAGLCATCGGEYRAGICPSCTLRIALDLDDEPEPEEMTQNPAATGAYELLEVIAQGGMGVVWRARQTRLRRVVALKLLRESCLPGEELARRFRIEAEAVSLLRHPHIVTVYEVGEMGGRYFLSMELLAGSLAGRLLERAFAPKEAAALLAKIAGAVQHAHERGVLHRDLKPSNILLDDAGEPRVSDFGLARLTEDVEHPTLSGALLGTPAYMAPEQADGAHGEVTTRSDVYSLGAIFYEMLTGRVPFEGASHLELLRQVADQNPTRPSSVIPGLDRDLETICLKCLEKAPAARYPSARTLAEDLDRWQRGEAIHARPASTPERLWKWSRRHKALAALIVTALGGALAIAVLSVAFTKQLQREVRRTTAAERIALHRLAAQYGETAAQLVQREDSLRALPYLAESCALLGDDPAAARIARLRFEAIVRTAPRLAQLWLPEDRLRGVDFDPHAQRVVIMAGETATIFDTATGQPVTPPLVHADEVLHGHLLERGNRLLCQTKSDQWVLWDARTGERIAAREGYIFPMKSALSVLDRGLAWRFLAWRKNVVQSFSLTDGTTEGDPIDAGGPVEWAMQSRIFRDVPNPGGLSIFLIATEDGRLHLWDPATRREAVPPLELGRNPLPRGYDWVNHRYAFEADEGRGLRLSQLDMATLRITEKTRSNTATHRVHGWLGSPRRWCVLAREDNGFTLRDTLTGSRLMFAHHEAQGFNAAVARDSGVLVTSSRDGALRIWNDGGKPATPYLLVGGRPEQLLLDDTGQQLVSASTEPAVRLWERRKDDGAAFADHEGAQLAGAFFSGNELVLARPDGRIERRDLAGHVTGPIAVGPGWNCGHPLRTAMADAAGRNALLIAEKFAALWDVKNGRRLGEAVAFPDGIRSAAISADGRRLALLSGVGTCVVGSPENLATVTLDKEAQSVVLSPDGRHLLVIGSKPAQLWSVSADQTPAFATLTATLSEAQGAAFSADGSRFVLWGLPQPLGATDARLFEATNGNAVFAPFTHTGDMTSAAFSPDGRLLLTTSRYEARLWDLASGKLLRALRDHPLPPQACGFSPDGTLLWTRTAKELCLWETATGAPLAPPMALQGLGSALWSADGRWLAGFDDEQAIRAWDLAPGGRSPEGMRALARLLSAHRLTPDGALHPLTPAELREAQAASVSP